MPRPVQTPSRDESRRMRSAARLYATQALFQMEATNSDLGKVQEEFETHRIGIETDAGQLSEADIDHFRALLKNAVNRQAEIDQLTDRALVAKWPIERIDPTIRALFRAAGSEMLAKKNPPKVTINEFVEVAKAFFPEGREAKFVNAVLDHMARETQPEAF